MVVVYIPLGHIAEHPRRLHDEQGTVLSHFNFSLKSDVGVTKSTRWLVIENRPTTFCARHHTPIPLLLLVDRLLGLLTFLTDICLGCLWHFR